MSAKQHEANDRVVGALLDTIDDLRERIADLEAYSK